MLLEAGRTLLSLALVLGLIWGIARVGRGRQLKTARVRNAGALGASQPIEVVGRRSLGRNCAVLVVRTENRTMVLGQTPQQITVLSEGEPLHGDRADTADQPPRVRHEDVMPGLASETGVLSPTAWDAIVDRLREMTVRH